MDNVSQSFKMEVQQKELEETMIFLGVKKELLEAYKIVTKKIIIDKIVTRRCTN